MVTDINLSMKTDSKYSLRFGITLKLVATALIFVSIIFIFVLFILNTVSKKSIKLNIESTIFEMEAYKANNSKEDFKQYILDFSSNVNKVGVFTLKQYKINIEYNNTPIDLSQKIESRIWSALSTKNDFFEIEQSFAYYATRVSPNSDTYLLIVQDVIAYHDYIKTFEIQFTILTFAILIVFIFLSSIWAKNISGPIEESTKAIKDVTNKKNLQLKKTKYKELNEFSIAVNKMVEELEEINNLDKDLLANVSHEFKTPLTLIKSYAEMIQDFSGEDKDLREEHLATIISEADHLTSLVNDVLSLSRAQAKLDTKYSIFCFTELVDSTVKNFSSLIKSRELKLTKDISEKLYISANYKQICEVVYNYISNAVNYAKSIVEIKLYSMEDRYRFEVTDDGSGIETDDIDSIWNKYYRGKNKPVANVKGTGLGLAIVKEILTSHSYPFGVVTLPGEGSTFYFEILREK